MELDDLSVAVDSGAAKRSQRWHARLRADLADLPDTILQLKVFQSLDSSPGSFPIYRSVRFAVRRSLEELFDSLALHDHWTAQRLAEAKLLIQGDGALVVADAHQKVGYISGRFAIWTDTVNRAHWLRGQLMALVGEQLAREETFTIDWRFISKSEGLTGVTFEELADSDLVDEAYPFIPAGLHGFVSNYLAAPETVLILQGPPGTGKTRLVRRILAAISRHKGDSARVLFTADRVALEGDEIFVDFLTGEHDAFFIEDADHLLGARSNGNTELHRFLTIADGVVRAQGRKIIFTTNLPNVGDIDEALLRPGRTFAVVQTRALTLTELDCLLARLEPFDARRRSAIMGQVSQAGKRSVSLAEAYRLLLSRGA
jgi:ATPase family associated with various cellular activities (AAA)